MVYHCICGIQFLSCNILFDHFEKVHGKNKNTQNDDSLSSKSSVDNEKCSTLDSNESVQYDSLSSISSEDDRYKKRLELELNYEIPSTSEIESEMSQSDDNDESVCPICSKELRSLPEVLKHCKNDHTNRFICCSYCYQPFKSKKDLLLHDRSAHSDGCNEVKIIHFVNNPIQDIFLLQIGGRIEKRMPLQFFKKMKTIFFENKQCCICDKIVSEPWRHLKKVHFKTKRICSKCGRMFPRIFQWRRHTRECSKIKQTTVAPDANNVANNRIEKPTHRCRVCSDKFTSAVAFLEHFELSHRIQLYPCSQCSEIYESPKQWKTHWQNKHNKI